VSPYETPQRSTVWGVAPDTASAPAGGNDMPGMSVFRYAFWVCICAWSNLTHDSRYCSMIQTYQRQHECCARGSKRRRLVLQCFAYLACRTTECLAHT
jgi:hypothetical protein